MAEYGKPQNKTNDVKNIGKDPSNKVSSFSNKSLNTPRAKRRLKVKLNVKLIFFRQLSVILLSGVPLSQGLELLSENITDKNFSACIKDISSQLGSGIDLSNALKNYPNIFDPIIIGLIEAGEAGGILSQVLERIALLLEAQNKLKSQITGALIYPLILLVLALTVSLGLLIFIVPTFDWGQNYQLLHNLCLIYRD